MFSQVDFITWPTLTLGAIYLLSQLVWEIWQLCSIISRPFVMILSCLEFVHLAVRSAHISSCVRSTNNQVHTDTLMPLSAGVLLMSSYSGNYEFITRQKYVLLLRLLSVYGNIHFVIWRCPALLWAVELFSVIFAPRCIFKTFNLSTRYTGMPYFLWFVPRTRVIALWADYLVSVNIH